MDDKGDNEVMHDVAKKKRKTVKVKCKNLYPLILPYLMYYMILHFINWYLTEMTFSQNAIVGDVRYVLINIEKSWCSKSITIDTAIYVNVLIFYINSILYGLTM